MHLVLLEKRCAVLEAEKIAGVRGVVTLHGTVRSLHELKHAEQVALRVDGIHDVVNELVVGAS